MRHDGIGQPRWVIDAGYAHENFRGHFLVELDVVLKGVVNGAHHRFTLHRTFLQFLQDLYLSLKERFLRHVFPDLHSAPAFNQQLDGAIR